MRLRLLDYVANPGGGVRFAVQLAAALMRVRPEIRLQLASHGPALERYATLFAAHGLSTEVIDLAPAQRGWCFGVPDEARRDCDHLYLPWLHRHAPPDEDDDRITASFHDAILFQHAGMFTHLIAPEDLDVERRATQAWFASQAEIAISSRATAGSIERIFGERDRCTVIPIASEHRHAESLPVRRDWDWARKPFLLCPANICPHKNHETLLRGFAGWGAHYPLALTGQATHLHACRWERAVKLRQLAEELGLGLGSRLHTLGYIDDSDYDALLRRAWALVMPTLAEGGGSFPVAEALHRGVPVVCSDIPPVREQVERVGAEVLWFDPHDASSLAAQLADLQNNYIDYKQRAMQQVPRLRRRTWDDVAREYVELFVNPDRIEASYA